MLLVIEGENMRIKKKGLGIKIIAITLILANYHFFYLISLPDIADTLLQKHNLSLIMAVYGILSYFYIRKNYRNELQKYRTILSKYYLFLITAYFAECVFTILKYDQQSVFVTIRFGANFLQLFLVPVYLVIFEIDGGYELFFGILNKISFVWFGIMIIQSTVYRLSGNLLFDFASYYSDAVYSRVYGIRIGLGMLGALMILYNFSLLYNQKLKTWKKFFSVIEIVVGIYALIFIGQTRTSMIYVFSAIAVQILLGNKSTKTRLKELVLIMIAFLVLYQTDANIKLINDMTSIEVAENGASSTARIYGLQYFWETFVHNPLFGNGFVSSAKNTPYFSIEHGSLGIAYYSDLGVIALLAETGLFSLAFFFIPIIKLIKRVSQIIKHRKFLNSDFVLSISVLFFLIISSVTLLVTDNGRDALFPIVFAYIMYVSSNLEDRTSKVTYGE